MNLHEKYQSLDGPVNGNARTVRARDRLSGAEVLIHFPATKCGAKELSEQAETLAQPMREQILEIGELEGMVFVVTPPGTQLPREWLTSSGTSMAERSTHDPEFLGHAGAWKLPRPAEAPVRQSASPAAAAGEFTQLFQTPMAATEVPLPPAAETPVAPVPSAPAAAAPGEFTQLFQTPMAAIARPLPPAAATPAIAPVPSSPGEFTRIFSTPAGTNSREEMPVLPMQTTIAPTQTTRVEEPGAFTRMFHSAPGGATPFVSQPAPSAAPPPAVSPAQDHGEFTRMFQSPAAPTPPPTQKVASMMAASAPVQPPALSGATGAFPGMRTPPAPVPSAGPSEFTRMISVPSPQVPPVEASARAPNVPASTIPAKEGMDVTLIVAIIEGVVILALALALFFALRK